jgi:DNA repair protein RAD7
MYQKSKPLPGQLENCEVCGKRFTVTPYSKAGPEGGLLCTPCGKQLAAEIKAEAKAKKPVINRKRRKMESDRLDGINSLGAKTLVQLCIEKVAQHHTDIDEFGDLPDMLVDRLSELFSKKRVMNSRTMQLFLRPDMDTVALHDCSCKPNVYYPQSIRTY